jgi:pyruvate, water dikinase
MLIKNLFRYLTYQVFSPGTVLREKYESFKALLEYDKVAHELMATLEDIYYTQKKCDFQAVVKTYGQFGAAVLQMVEELLKMSPSSYWSLKAYFKKFDFYIRFMLAPPEFKFSPPFTIGFDKISSSNESLAGKKAFSLSCLNKALGLPTPDGFVITTNAFHFFLEANDLRDPINHRLALLDINDVRLLERTALEIEQLILNAMVPKDIDIAITDALNSLEQINEINFRVALRSSAVKEDGKASFAGQYKTLLNVKKQNILTGYKQIIASKYSAQALFYRISHGILDYETPMAVLILEMVDSKASGVMYTRDSENLLSGHLLIHSVWGQGELLVEGEVSPDVIRVSKKDPDTIVSTKIAAKQKQMVLEPKIQTRIIDTNPAKKDLISLDKTKALALAKMGFALESHFKQPQDIEWCQDKEGRLFILQSRPLNIHPAQSLNDAKKAQTPENKIADKIMNKIICSGGESVCAGVGSGPVYRLEQLSQIPHIPEGSVLVVKNALPQFVRAIDKMAAIIIKTGSRASHFSSIAREFGVPAIVNPKKGFHDLTRKTFVTVDADKGIVYEGRVESLLKKATLKPDFFTDSSFMVKLQYVINFCAKLKLTDPSSNAFVPEGCRSLHDIIRFTHETAMREMFLIGNRKGGRKKGAKKLVSKIPMLFYVLDVGRGVKDDAANGNILKPENIASIPMNAILKGLSHPKICWSETTHFDWEEYDKIVMAGGIVSADSPMFGSYAVVSKEYLNGNFRFGYHFVVIDTICSSLKQDNYILFRFSGGGGSPEGRALRADFIKTILTRLGFMVEIKSDLIDAQFRQGSLKTMQKNLDMIGRLLGATKLMDMYLKENLEMDLLVDDFMNGRYDFRSAIEGT